MAKSGQDAIILGGSLSNDVAFWPMDCCIEQGAGGLSGHRRSSQETTYPCASVAERLNSGKSQLKLLFLFGVCHDADMVCGCNA